MCICAGSQHTMSKAVGARAVGETWYREVLIPTQCIHSLTRATLRAMLGPRCDENGDAYDKLAQKMQHLHDVDFVKSKMKIEMWTFKGDGTMLVSATAATSIFKYMYTGSRDHMARTQRRVFELCRIPHILIEVPGVRTDMYNAMLKPA
jgi:hypothetical protein